LAEAPSVKSEAAFVFVEASFGSTTDAWLIANAPVGFTNASFGSTNVARVEPDDAPGKSNEASVKSDGAFLDPEGALESSGVGPREPGAPLAGATGWTRAPPWRTLQACASYPSFDTRFW
jgi:hypothetical protein